MHITIAVCTRSSKHFAGIGNREIDPQFSTNSLLLFLSIGVIDVSGFPQSGHDSQP